MVKFKHILVFNLFLPPNLRMLLVSTQKPIGIYQPGIDNDMTEITIKSANY